MPRTRVQGETEFEVKLGGSPSSSLAVTAEIVYVGCDDGYLYAFDALDGREVFKFKTKGAIHSAPIEKAGVVYFGSSDGSVHAVDGSLGSEIFAYDAAGAVNTRSVALRHATGCTPGAGRLLCGATETRAAH